MSLSTFHYSFVFIFHFLILFFYLILLLLLEQLEQRAALAFLFGTWPSAIEGSLGTTSPTATGGVWGGSVPPASTIMEQGQGTSSASGDRRGL